MKYRIFVLLLGLALLCGCAASPTEPSALREPEPTPDQGRDIVVVLLIIFTHFLQRSEKAKSVDDVTL